MREIILLVVKKFDTKGIISAYERNVTSENVRRNFLEEERISVR